MTNCKHLKYFRLITKKDIGNSEQQRNNLEQIRADLERRHISFFIKFEETLHDRKIL